MLQESTNRALQDQRQLRASYDRLLAAFGAKCTALKGAQDSSAEAHEQFRKQLTVRKSCRADCAFCRFKPVHIKNDLATVLSSVSSTVRLTYCCPGIGWRN
eukprot:COSAG02_NODE_75_length_41389_cov_106.665762_17_plen_101_part_00